MTYSMTCTCGHVMSVDAENRDAAVSQLQSQMTPDAIAAHMAEKHPGEAVPPTEAMHADIARNMQPA